MLWILYVLGAAVLTLWLVVQVARLGRSARWLVWYPAFGAVPVRMYTRHWFGRLVPQAGLTLRRRIYLDFPGIGEPGTPVTTRDMLLHELAHVAQAERFGFWYVPAYFWGQVRSWGRGHEGHAMERDADQVVARYLAGEPVLSVPPELLALYPTPSPRRAV